MIEKDRKNDLYPKKIRLEVVIDAIETADDVFLQFYDMLMGETVYLPSSSSVAEEDPELAALLEDQADRFVRFPTQYDIQEYSIMEAFAESLLDEKMADELLRAIRGRGAFARFKQTIRYLGIEARWYAFRARAYRELAVEWCKENDFEYEESE